MSKTSVIGVRRIALLLTALLAVSWPVTAYADIVLISGGSEYASETPQSSLSVARPDFSSDKLAALSVDAFEIVYTPAKGSAAPLQTVYVLGPDGMKRARERGLMDGLSLTDKGGVFTMAVRNHANPYTEADARAFEDYRAWRDGFLASRGFGEISVSLAHVRGVGADYHIIMPMLDSVIGLRAALPDGSLALDSLMFIYPGASETTVCTLSVYNKADWANAIATEIAGAKYAVAMELMGYVFALLPGDNPFAEGTPDYKAFEAASETIKTAVGKVYVFNDAETLGLSVNPKNPLPLAVGGGDSAGRILFDSKNHPLFPLRALAEGLGYRVGWKPDDRVFTITTGDRLIAAKKIETVYTIDSYAESETALCSIIGGRSYVDLNFVIDTMGCELRWDGTNIIAAKR
ncbi:MAG: copper amine oxidase N-terminal domain-containing protein [Clostridiales bacterium]|nr:copper amine oxidase N-terminal domain-containing protein [Clostridiales bacterium]